MFDHITIELAQSVTEWEKKFDSLSEEQISAPRNRQNRNIRQIIGHMVDSASNNIHRVVHLQYQETPLEFPNYATYGNNDHWIAIQNYETEKWNDLVQLWKYTNLHLAHVIQNINPDKLENEWLADKDVKVSLKEMVEDFMPHFWLHISEIKELIKIKTI